MPHECPVHGVPNFGYRCCYSDLKDRARRGAPYAWAWKSVREPRRRVWHGFVLSLGEDYHPAVANEDSLDAVVRRIRERIAAYRPKGIGEQNTKAALIAPLLRALGWDTEDLSQVHLEYRPRSSDKPVDYSLLLNGQPRVFVEAKALGQNLNDRRWASQIMGYAGVAGVSWVVLTDGDEYRVYNAHATVPVEQKLFREVRISDEQSESEATLALLSKESIAELEALWQESFVDRQVQEAVDALFAPEADDGLVRLLRRRLPPEVTTRQLRASLARLRSPAQESAAVVQAVPTRRSSEAKFGIRTTDVRGGDALEHGYAWGLDLRRQALAASRPSPSVQGTRCLRADRARRAGQLRGTGAWIAVRCGDDGAPIRHRGGSARSDERLDVLEIPCSGPTGTRDRRTAAPPVGGARRKASVSGSAA